MISLLVVAHTRLYLDALTELLDGQDGMTIVGTASGREHVGARVRDSMPDVVVVDMATPRSLEIIRDVATGAPRVPVVALAVPETEREIVACAEAGVWGFIPREASADELVAAVLASANGKATCPPSIAAHLLRRLRSSLGEPSVDRTSHHNLTVRQLQVARLMREGLSNKEIAARLYIAVPTVKNHVHEVLKRLGVDRREHAAHVLDTIGHEI